MITPTTLYRTTPDYLMAFDEGYEYAKAQALAILSRAMVEISSMGATTTETFTISTPKK